MIRYIITPAWLRWRMAKEVDAKPLYGICSYRFGIGRFGLGVAEMTRHDFHDGTFVVHGMKVPSSKALHFSAYFDANGAITDAEGRYREIVGDRRPLWRQATSRQMAYLQNAPKPCKVTA